MLLYALKKEWERKENRWTLSSFSFRPTFTKTQNPTRKIKKREEQQLDYLIYLLAHVRFRRSRFFILLTWEESLRWKRRELLYFTLPPLQLVCWWLWNKSSHTFLFKVLMFYEMTLLLLREWYWHKNNKYTIEENSGDETSVKPCHKQSKKYNIYGLIHKVVQL